MITKIYVDEYPENCKSCPLVTYTDFGNYESIIPCDCDEFADTRPNTCPLIREEKIVCEVSSQMSEEKQTCQDKIKELVKNYKPMIMFISDMIYFIAQRVDDQQKEIDMMKKLAGIK